MSIDGNGQRHNPKAAPGAGQFATGARTEPLGVTLDAPAGTTAAQVLVASTRAGMEANAWTFEQAADAAVAAMILTDRDAMVALAAQLRSTS
jgi:hypothetical protein